MNPLGTTPAHDVTVALPRQWATHQDPEQGIVLAARARFVPASGFPPELVLRTAPMDADLHLDAWRDGAMTDLGAQLDGFDVEDEDHFELAGHPVAYRRFAHRAGSTEVVCDQWAWVVDGVGITLTGSVARGDYADYCDLFEEVAATVEVVPRAAA